MQRQAYKLPKFPNLFHPALAETLLTLTCALMTHHLSGPTVARYDGSVFQHVPHLLSLIAECPSGQWA